MSEVRALAINAMLSQRISETELMVEDKARELILPFLQLQRNFENTAGPFGFLPSGQGQRPQYFYSG